MAGLEFRLAGGLEFRFDMKALDKWQAAWKAFPKEAGKWMAKCVNDMAFEFRDIYFDVISERYTIRDQGFIRKTITVEKAKPSRWMEKITATVGTWTGALKTGTDRFSGFTEELGLGSNHTKDRVITRWGRKGRSKEGIAEPWARLHSTGERGDSGKGVAPTRIPNSSALNRMPANQRFPALTAMMASGKLHVPKKYPAFILHADNGKEPGLFRFRKALPSMKGMKRKEWDEARYDAKLDRIQYFERPVKPPTWDWRGECEKRLHEFFDEGFIFRHYIAPAILGIMPEKKPYTPKG